MKYDTFCPLFPGFYNTVFEYNRESEDIEYYNEENGTNLDYDDFNWDYKGYEERAAKSFIGNLESELTHLLPIKIDFQDIYSPKEYNFRNDSINISVDINLDDLIQLVKDRYEESEKYFKDKYTSCSGFISFHSNDIDDWINKDYIIENTAHRVGALLDCLATIEINQDNVIYWADEAMYLDFWPKDQTAN